MKTLLMFFCFLFMASSAHAQWMVTDPGSYTYYVQQINQQVKMVEEAAKQVETLGGVLTEAKKLQSAVTGTYNRAVGLVGRIQGVSKALERDSGGGIFNEAKKWGNVGRSIGSAGSAAAGTVGSAGRVVKDVNDISGDDRYTDTKAMLDEVFADPRDINNADDRHRSLSRRYQVQQGALKEVVARAENTLGGMKDRMKIVEELAGMIDKTVNQKDAQDLTNRILVEILATLIDSLQVAALANQADALNNFQGANDSTMAARKKVLESTKDSAASIQEIIGKSSTRL